MVETGTQPATRPRFGTILRRRKWFVILPILASVAAAYALSTTRPNTYTATASVVFKNVAIDQQLFGNSVVTSGQDPDRVAATNVTLLHAPAVATRTAEVLAGSIADVRTPREVRAHIHINPQGISDAVDISAVTRTAVGAARLANTYAEQFISSSRETAAQPYSRAASILAAQIAAGVGDSSSADQDELRARLSELRVLAAVQTGGVRLVEAATAPGSPSGPAVKRDTLAGLLVGLALALLAVAVVERVDNRVRDAQDAEEAFAMPLIGTVPRDRGLRLEGARPEGAGAVDAFRLVRAQLRYFNVETPVTSILVTSPASGDGKTTVAWNLARAEAATRSEADGVVLVEADLRRPTLARTPGLEVGPGLAELLSNVASLDDVLQPVEVAADFGLGAANMTVITAGHRPPNPAALLESNRAAALLAELQERFSLVLIDAPPTLVVSDAIPWITRVDGVLVVGRLGHTTRASARRMHEQLRMLHAATLGVVLNGVKEPDSPYYYAPAPATSASSR